MTKLKGVGRNRNLVETFHGLPDAHALRSCVGLHAGG